MATCDRASFSAASFSELSRGSRSRETATSAKTRAASFCASALARATSSEARQARGRPRESLEKDRENARFIKVTTFRTEVNSWIFAFAASCVFFEALPVKRSSSFGSKPNSASAEASVATCFACRAATTALTPSHRSEAASSSADAIAEPTERSIERSRSRVVSVTRS